MTDTCRMCNGSIDFSMSLSFLLFLKKSVIPTLCTLCSEKFERLLPFSVCKGCCKSSVTNTYCLDCLRWKKIYPEMFVSHKSLYRYNDFAKEWMKQLKFTGDIFLAKSLNIEIKKYIQPHLKNKIIIPVPSSKESLEERGFNQVETLLKFAEIPYFNYLIHIGKTQRQAKKNRKERLETNQPFEINEDFKNDVEGQEILLVDDVYTTGRTLYHARKCLYDLGAKTVYSMTIFR